MQTKSITGYIKCYKILPSDGDGLFPSQFIDHCCTTVPWFRVPREWSTIDHNRVSAGGSRRGNNVILKYGLCRRATLQNFTSTFSTLTVLVKGLKIDASRGGPRYQRIYKHAYLHT